MTEYLKGKLQFNIAELLIQTTQTQDDVYLEISPCKVLSGFETIDIEQISKIRFEYENAQAWVYVTLNNGTIIPYDDIQTENPSGLIELYGASYYENVPDITAVITKMDNDYSIFTYRLNSERKAINKDLIFVSLILGTFKSDMNIKTPTLLIQDYEIKDTFNYIYISSLNRYYFVNDINLTTKNITALSLAEDVLMTHKDLILRQSAFVTRSQALGDDKIIDDRYPLQSVKDISYIAPIPTTTDNKVNITLKTDFTTEYNYLVSGIMESLFTKDDVSSPDTYLPNISPIQAISNAIYFLNSDRMNSLMKALIDDDNMATYINAIMFLPFDPSTAFNVTNINPLVIGVPTSKALCDDNKFHELSSLPSGVVPWSDIRRSKYGTSPYLVLADFTFPSDNDIWKDREPYTIYEIYVAFVGWVKIDIEQVKGKRILIYYTLDFQTGNATAYIYNKTDGKIIYSCGCQLGVKIDIFTSNGLELARERQANELNTLIGLLASAVSIGAGVVTENPVAIAGGVLSAGKTIASAVNKDRMLFERAQVTYGSTDAGLHSNLLTMLRKTTYQTTISDADEEAIYLHMQGKPTNKYIPLTDITTGYFEVGEIHFNPMGEDIYNTEINEIVALLHDGVIL